MNEKLEPIKFDNEYSAFNIDDFDTNLKTELFLVDGGWMDYVLRASIPTKQYGNIRIEFEYYGIRISVMRVWTEKAEKKKYVFEFYSEIFQQHIIKFMYKHIASWNEEYSFEGLEEVINFYNAVVTDPRTLIQELI